MTKGDSVWAKIESSGRENTIGKVVSKTWVVVEKGLEGPHVMFEHLWGVGGKGAGLEACQTFEGFVVEETLDESLAGNAVNEVPWPLMKD